MKIIEEKNLSIEKFKKQYKKENIKIEYLKFDNLFYVESFFSNKDLPFTEEKFYETLIEVVSNTLKSYIQELEYYVNIKPSTPQMSSDSEIIFKEKDKLQKFYLNLHIYYKKYHLLYLKSKLDTNEVVNFLEEIFEKVSEFNKYSIKLQTKLITNLKEKLEEVSKEKVVQYESSIFN
ncbi:MAG: hypothetical protein PF569_04180 [Candidatus Woesearchaeota archaeon]|jgi:hypothetical protein|nr:hypothetical protein [Candidatus Woesearchaeota archaeon]